MKDLLGEAFDTIPKVNKHETISSVKTYGSVGKTLYTGNVMEVAQKLAKIAESAHDHILSETDDWFDKVSLNKNMKTLKGSVVEFTKAATEAHMLNQRLTGLYEDIGHVLNRYYDISEGEDHIDDKEAATDFDDLEDKDIDNDGDTDDSDEYLHHKLGVVAKKTEALDSDKAPDGGGDEEDLAARDGEDMKEVKRSLKDVGGVVSMPSLGQIARKFTKK